MDRTERLYLIDQLLQKRRFTFMDLLMYELEVFKSTVKRNMNTSSLSTLGIKYPV